MPYSRANFTTASAKGRRCGRIPPGDMEKRKLKMPEDRNSPLLEPRVSGVLEDSPVSITQIWRELINSLMRPAVPTRTIVLSGGFIPLLRPVTTARIVALYSVVVGLLWLMLSLL
jgi:hypothetical protein